jgi:hypothetical protein
LSVDVAFGDQVMVNSPTEPRPSQSVVSHGLSVPATLRLL